MVHVLGDHVEGTPSGTPDSGEVGTLALFDKGVNLVKDILGSGLRLTLLRGLEHVLEDGVNVPVGFRSRHGLVGEALHGLVKLGVVPMGHAHDLRRLGEPVVNVGCVAQGHLVHDLAPEGGSEGVLTHDPRLREPCPDLAAPVMGGGQEEIAIANVPVPGHVNALGELDEGPHRFSPPEVAHGMYDTLAAVHNGSENVEDLIVLHDLVAVPYRPEDVHGVTTHNGVARGDEIPVPEIDGGLFDLPRHEAVLLRLVDRHGSEDLLPEGVPRGFPQPHHVVVLVQSVCHVEP